MRKLQGCDFCKRKINYEGHLMFLALLHLEIEYFPRTAFAEDELFDKVTSLIFNINPFNIHINIAYSTTQLLNTSNKYQDVVK